MIPADATIFDWAQALAALFTSLSVALLVWDRLRPKPHQLATSATGFTNRNQVDWVDLVVASETGESFIIQKISCPRGMGIALAPASIIALGLTQPPHVGWSRSLRIVVQRSPGHGLDVPPLKLFFLDRRPRWLMRWLPETWSAPLLEVSGVFPFRKRRKFSTGVRIWPKPKISGA